MSESSRSCREMLWEIIPTRFLLDSYLELAYANFASTSFLENALLRACYSVIVFGAYRKEEMNPFHSHPV